MPTTFTPEEVLASQVTSDPEVAAKVSGLINGTLDPEGFASVDKWISQCYNRPKNRELVMQALNEVLEDCGIEAITPEGKVYPVADYVNNGDTYNVTVVYDLEKREYLLTSWGDFLKAWEAENAEVEPDDEEDSEVDADPVPEEEPVECPQCGGEGAELGALGNTKHFRCRNCGWTFSA